MSKSAYLLIDPRGRPSPQAYDSKGGAECAADAFNRSLVRNVAAVKGVYWHVQKVTMHTEGDD